MATSKFYITAGFVPKDNQGDDGSTKFYITAGLVKDDPEAEGELSIPVVMKYYQNMRKA